ncbi:MAG: HAD-IIIA family hydrolase [Actinomycetota bacterium]|jgi:D-glycero-D-manno-heptose 1,7-bisphosphate phosphatase|nr:HAD-IIIA family hydrolase [Actinomycetota bacterium]
MYEPILVGAESTSRRVRAVRGLLLCDRDGVIIEDRPTFVRRSSDIVVYPGAVEALVRAGEQGIPVVIISNQSGIGRGVLRADDAIALHRGLVADLQLAGVPILGSFLCPHAPEAGCECRKPSPRMLIAATAEYGFSLDRTAFVGDSRVDMEAAVAAGVYPVLVATGRGADEVEAVSRTPRLSAVQMARDLSEAVDYVCQHLGPEPGSLALTRRP